MLACYGIVLEYYTGKKYDWPELKILTGFDKKAVWSIQALINISNLGIKIISYDSIDYEKYYQQGEKYIKDYLTKDEYDWYINNAEPLKLELIPDFNSKVSYLQKSATLKDIDHLLKNNLLVMVGLNSRALNNKPGFVSHGVVVLDKDGDNYIIHDPGLPPKPYRKVNEKLLYEAMGGPGHNNEVTGFGKK